MFKTIDDMPENVVGFEVSGKLTHEDYVDGMLPLCDEMLAKHKSVKMLLVIDESFTGMELSAMWDDMNYGLKHWHDMSHIAAVTDISWMRAMMAVMTPFFPGEVKFFKLAEVEQAKAWVLESESVAA